MTLRTDKCSFRQVSQAGHALIHTEDHDALVAFTRATLSCPRLRQCRTGDCCTIFCASLLSETARAQAEKPAS